MPDKIQQFKRQAVGTAFVIDTTDNEWYNTKRWKNLSRMFRRTNPLCNRCGIYHINVFLKSKVERDSLWLNEYILIDLDRSDKGGDLTANLCERDKRNGASGTSGQSGTGNGE